MAAAAGLRISDAAFADAKATLREFVAIPSVSNQASPYYSPDHLQEAADFAARRLRVLTFDVHMVSINHSAPYVIARKVIDVALPTITLYAHYDVQPVEDEKWVTPPFELSERDGRLYGRGASDDKGGIVAILAALEVFQNAGRSLPCNVIVFLEGEEEIGSPNMNAFLEIEKENIKSDALIVLDGMNRDAETGSLTYSTRGLAGIEMTVRGLEQPIHSGIGCLAPDVAMAMCSALASLEDPQAIGLTEGASALTQEERAFLGEGSITAEQYAHDVAALPGGRLRGNPEESIFERIQTHPSVSIVNMNVGNPHGGNSIQDQGYCEIGVRIVPGQNPRGIGQKLIDHLQAHPALQGFEVGFNLSIAASAWKADRSKPISRAYFDALGERFGQNQFVPCGGTLPLLEEFSRVFPDMALIVPGVEDPHTNAHSHNESQHVTLFHKAIDSLILFLEKVGG